MGKHKKLKCYNQWKMVAKWLKSKRLAAENLFESQMGYAVKRSIKRWRARTEATQAARSAFAKFRLKKAMIYKRGVFRELAGKRQRDRTLLLTFSGIAAKFDNKHLQSAM